MIQPWEHWRELVREDRGALVGRNEARVWVGLAVLAAFAIGLGTGTWWSGHEDAHRYEMLGAIFAAYLLAFALYHVYAATQRL